MTTNSATTYPGTVLALLLVISLVTEAKIPTAMTPTVIEIFSTSDQPFSAVDSVVKKYPQIELHIHQLDHINILEDQLSLGLSADPETAKRRVLERLQQLTPGTRSRLEHSATALATAVQYGVEQYPAIVFDRELVVYGLTDLSVALMHYRWWRAAERP